VRLGGLSPDRIVPEAWRLPTPASPHIAARAAGVKIDVAALHPPRSVAHMIIETAGGVMVPLTEDFLTIDLLARWRLPAILVARTGLGTINHSLLTLEALRQRDIVVACVSLGDCRVSIRSIVRHCAPHSPPIFPRRIFSHDRQCTVAGMAAFHATRLAAGRRQNCARRRRLAGG
jgi:hypothetical protein